MPVVVSKQNLFVTFTVIHRLASQFCVQLAPVPTQFVQFGPPLGAWILAKVSVFGKIVRNVPGLQTSVAAGCSQQTKPICHIHCHSSISFSVLCRTCTWLEPFRAKGVDFRPNFGRFYRPNFGRLPFATYEENRTECSLGLYLSSFAPVCGVQVRISIFVVVKVGPKAISRFLEKPSETKKLRFYRPWCAP